MLQGAWTEAHTKEVSIPHQDARIFALYEKVVIYGAVAALDTRPGRWGFRDEGYARRSCNEPNLCRAEYERMVKLYLLAQYLQDDEAREAAANAIQCKVKHECEIMRISKPCLPPASAIREMWELTPNHCLGRQAILGCFLWYGSASEAFGIEDVPLEFIYSMYSCMLAHRLPPLSDITHAGTLRLNENETVEDDSDGEREGERPKSPGSDTTDSSGETYATDETMGTESTEMPELDGGGTISGSLIKLMGRTRVEAPMV